MLFQENLRALASRAGASRRATRPAPRTLRGTQFMEGSFLQAPRMACLARPGCSGDVSVVPYTTWVNFNRHGGAGRKISVSVCHTVVPVLR